jgi:hypothetical protein
MLERSKVVISLEKNTYIYPFLRSFLSRDFLFYTILRRIVLGQKIPFATQLLRNTSVTMAKSGFGPYHVGGNALIDCGVVPGWQMAFLSILLPSCRRPRAVTLPPRRRSLVGCCVVVRRPISSSHAVMRPSTL